MHCHSTAPQLSRLGVQSSLGLPGVRDASAGGLRAGEKAGDGRRDDPSGSSAP